MRTDLAIPVRQVDTAMPPPQLPRNVQPILGAQGVTKPSSNTKGRRDAYKHETLAHWVRRNQEEFNPNAE